MSFKSRIYTAYSRFARSSGHAYRGISDRGRLVITGTILCAALGIDTDLTLIYQLFALMLSLIIVSRLSLRFDLVDIQARRTLPRFATAGEPFEYQVSLTNRGHKIQKDLLITDQPETRIPTLKEFLTHKEPFEETRNAWDRFIGYHRFMWLQKQKTGINLSPAPVPELPARGKNSVRITAIPLRRGTVTFSALNIMKPDPFGLHYKIEKTRTTSQLIVLPKRYRTSSMSAGNKGRHLQPGGLHSTWSVGESDEIVSLREFREGDSFRRIHWASSARRQKLIVKEFQDEYFVRHALILDTECADEEIFEECVSVIASFAEALNTPDTLTDLIYATDNGARIITVGRGYGLIQQQMEELALVNTSSSSLDILKCTLESHARLIAGAIIVLNKWDEKRKGLVDPLRAQGINPKVLVITREYFMREPGIEFIPVDQIQNRLLSLQT